MTSEDASSHAISTPASTLSWDFDAYFRAEYPHPPLPPSKNRRQTSNNTRKTTGPKVYVCLRCVGSKPWSTQYRPNAIKHAENLHIKRQRNEASIMSSQQSMSSYTVAYPTRNTLANAFNRQLYREAIIGLLTRRRIAFSAVEWSELQDLALACNPAIKDSLITSRRTAMRLIDANFALYASQLRENLGSASSLIHISSDLWTSPHRHGVLAVCTHWVDKDYQLRKALLALPECRYDHSGKSQAARIAKVLSSFDITASKLGYHTSDNATSNDTCLEHLSSHLLAEYGVTNMNAELPIGLEIMLIRIGGF
jgi:hypothetical protein